MKYLIWFNNGEDDIVHFFKTEEEMKEKVKEYLVKADNEMQDLEGKYPNWVNEFTTAKIIGEFRQIPFESELRYVEVK